MRPHSCFTFGRRSSRALLVAFGLAAVSPAFAQLNLANYQATSIALSLPGNIEVSGVTANRDNGRLYAIEDEGTILYELNTSGAVLSTMSLSGFADVEGITYIGGGQFLLAEERLQSVYRFTYSAGGSINRAALPTFNFGPTVANIGLEGVAYDFVNNVVLGVKEKSAQAIYTASIDFPTMTGTVSSFVPSLGLLDLSDVEVLNGVTGLIGSSSENNLLILSQESRLLVEVTRTGTVVGSFDLSALSGAAEGVTIGADGTIYIVSEDPNLIVLTPIPEPSAYAFALGVATVAGTWWRRRTSRQAAAQI